MTIEKQERTGKIKGKTFRELLRKTSAYKGEIIHMLPNSSRSRERITTSIEDTFDGLL